MILARTKMILDIFLNFYLGRIVSIPRAKKVTNVANALLWFKSNKHICWCLFYYLQMVVYWRLHLILVPMDAKIVDSRYLFTIPRYQPATLLCCDDIMLHFRILPVPSTLETMTDCLTALIINGLMRVSIMVLVVMDVMPGWEGTRLLEDGECVLAITPMTLMTPWDCPQVRSSSSLMMDLGPDSPAQWMIISLVVMIMSILTVIGQCDVVSK